MIPTSRVIGRGIGVPYNRMGTFPLNPNFLFKPSEYRAASPPLAFINQGGSLTPTGGTRASTAYKETTSNWSVSTLSSVAINYIRSGTVYDQVNDLWLPNTLLEPERTNTILQSEDMTTSWGKTRSSITNTSSTTLPDGTASGDDVLHEDATASHSHYVAQGSLTTSADTWCYSVFGKAINRSWLAIRLACTQNHIAWFNLSTGAVGANKVGITDLGTIDYGNGWYRCWMTFTGEALARTSYVYVCDKAGDDGDNFPDAFDGQNQDSFYLWGFQLEKGAFPSSYIKTTTTAVKREADTSLVWDVGTTFNSGSSTLWLPVLVPEHAPAADLELVKLYKAAGEATDHLTLAVEASTGKLKGLSAKSGGNAGSAVVNEVIADGEIHWIGLTGGDGSITAFANDYGTLATDTSADLPTDFDSISIEPSGAFVGTISAYRRKFVSTPYKPDGSEEDTV